MDQAGWHTSNKLGNFENVTPIMLPPYSPELNPVEQVWQWLEISFYQTDALRIMKTLLIPAVILGTG